MTKRTKEIFREGDSVAPGDVVYLPVVFSSGGVRYNPNSSEKLQPLRVVEVGMFGKADCFCVERADGIEERRVGLPFFFRDLVGREVVRQG